MSTLAGKTTLLVTPFSVRFPVILRLSAGIFSTETSSNVATGNLAASKKSAPFKWPTKSAFFLGFSKSKFLRLLMSISNFPATNWLSFTDSEPPLMASEPLCVVVMRAKPSVPSQPTWLAAVSMGSSRAATVCAESTVLASSVCTVCLLAPPQPDNTNDNKRLAPRNDGRDGFMGEKERLGFENEKTGRFGLFERYYFRRHVSRRRHC